MCARHGRAAIEIWFSKKGVLAKKRLGNTAVTQFQKQFGKKT